MINKDTAIITPVGDSLYICDCETTCSRPITEAKANAALIVRAVNNYDALLAAAAAKQGQAELERIFMGVQTHGTAEAWKRCQAIAQEQHNRMMQALAALEAVEKGQ